MKETDRHTSCRLLP